jgi:DNA-binding beta-propeller fold protein YncE
MKKFLLLAFFIAVASFNHSGFAEPILFYQGLTNPSGIAIPPDERILYVISGTSGSVWTIEINGNGTAGPLRLLSESFPPNLDIEFDASGNLYGLSDELYRLQSSGTVDNTRLSYDKGTAIAIEKPGLSSNKLYYSYESSSIPWIYIDDYTPGGYINREGNLRSCGPFRFFHYRQELNDIVATLEDRVVSINPTSGVCSSMISGLVQPTGIAVDLAGNVYVADMGSGEIIMKNTLGAVKIIASELDSPIGLVYDEATNSLFIAEFETGRILKMDLTNTTEVCGGGIVFGKNPITGNWAAFLSVCDVPYGWTVSNIAPEWFLSATGLKQPRIPVFIPLGD